MRNPWGGVFSALRLAALGCSSLLAACGGSADDRSVIDAPSEPAPAADEAGVEQSPVGPSGPEREVSGPRPEPADTPAASPPARPRCDLTNELGTPASIQTRAQLEALAGCEVLRGHVRIYISEGMDLTPLASLRTVEDTLWIGSDVLDPDASPTPARLASLRGLEKLESARSLFIQHAEGGLAPLENLGDVEALALSDLPGVVDLRGLANVRVTRALSLDSLPDLVSLEGVAVPVLDELSLSNTPKLETLGGLDGLQSLRALNIYEGATALNELGLPASLIQLTSVYIDQAPLLTSLAELSRFSSIESLRVHGSPLVADLGGGGVASGSLQTLHVHDAPLLTRLDPVGGFAGLVELELSNCDGITEIDALSASRALEYMGILDNDGLTRLPAFDQAGSAMRRIIIWNNAALVEGPSFPNLTTMYLSDGLNYESAELDIQDNPALRSIGNFPRLESASMVTISNNASLESVSLPSLERLIALRLYNDASLSALELSIERDLRSVELGDMPLLADVELGAPTSSLNRLTLRNTPRIDPEVRQQLLVLVDEGTQLTLD